MSQPTTTSEGPADKRDLIQTSIRHRWSPTEWDVLFPWWLPPAKVSILMYADGKVCFSENFFGLQYVRTVLESRLYPYADFDITTAHRDGDPCDRASRPTKLTEIDLNRFDEIWFFGFETSPNLSPAEKALLDKFMANKKQGGVLVTGDHGDRGKSIAGQITRAGEMRQYPAPGSESRGRNTTLEEGPDENELFDENDQHDERAQKLRLTRFPLWTPLGFSRRFRPHPVMCTPGGGLIDVFPDHGHEGEAVTPKKPSATVWPKVNNWQELPVVIAWGKIKDCDTDKFGQEIGLVSAYDGHRVNLGRIVADSSWHHWFDENLLGLPGRRPPDPYAGFDATLKGRAVLSKLDAYFLNCATWLAPPDKQAEMGRAAWWSVVWTGQIAELSINAPLWHLGAEALEVLGQHTSGGAAMEFVLNIPAFRKEISNQPLPKITEQFQLINLPFEQYVAGGIIHELMRKVGPANTRLRFPSEPPPDKDIERAINDGVELGMKALTNELAGEVTRLLGMVKNKFR